MIERLLAADEALARDDLETAAKLFGQVAEADPRNAIAAVGLGRVAAGRDDAQEARVWFLRALEIDPDEAAAKRLLAALERELTSAAVAPSAAVAAGAIPAQPSPGSRVAMPAVGDERPAASRPVEIAAPTRRSLVERLRAWLGLAGRRS